MSGPEPVSGRLRAPSLLAASLLLAGCAALRYDAGRELLAGRAPQWPPAPDSLRAEIDFTALKDGRKTSVAGALSALPGRKYKLDLMGPLGVLGGSFLWTDTGWTLVLFDRDGYLRGTGERAAIPGMAAVPLSVHDLFAFLWGDFFPELSDSAARSGEAFRKSGDGTLAYGPAGEEWLVRFDPATGLPRSAARGDTLVALAFGDWRRQGDRPLPGRVRLEVMGEPALLLRARRVEDLPAWRRDPFFIKVPKGFARLEALR